MRREYLAGRTAGVITAGVSISPEGEVYLTDLLFPAMGDDERGFLAADDVELRRPVRIPLSALQWGE